MSASQAEHEGSIPFTCSIVNRPGNLVFSTVFGLFSFLCRKIEHVILPLFCRFAGGKGGGINQGLSAWDAPFPILVHTAVPAVAVIIVVVALEILAL
jgi:hypothetical protein